MSEPIYRQLDKGTFQARGNDRHWVENDRHYLITELVPRMDGGANFQAVLVADDTPVADQYREYVSDEKPGDEVEDWPDVDLDKLVAPAVVIACEGPPCRCGEEAALKMGRCFAADLPPEPYQPSEFPPLPPPPLKEWAKKNGMWTGRGPVSGAAKAAYAREFGV